jgi:hypothetical protein
MTGSRKRRGSGGGSHRCRAAPADDNRAGSLSGGPARRRGTISEDDNATEGSPGVITTWTPTPRSYGRGSRCQAPSQRQRRSRSRSTPRPRRTAPTTDYIDRVDRSRRRVEQSAGSTHARAWIPSGALLPLVRVNVLTLYISLTVATTDLFVCAVHNLIAVIDTVCRDHPIYSHPTLHSPAHMASWEIYPLAPRDGIIPAAAAPRCRRRARPRRAPRGRLACWTWAPDPAVRSLSQAIVLLLRKDGDTGAEHPDPPRHSARVASWWRRARSTSICSRRSAGSSGFVSTGP